MRYGITIGQKQRYILIQRGKCKICGIDVLDIFKARVDHDHKTGKIRGILCNNCNSGLGFFQDDPILLAQAIEYLTRERIYSA